MGLFDWMLGDLYEDPAENAQPYLEQIPGTIKPYYEPYMEAGKRGLSGFESQTNRLMDPGKFVNEIGAGYHESPGFQFALKQALQGAGHAAAAGGMAGSPMHEQQNMDISTQLANRDYQNYLSNALQSYDMGYEGLGKMGQMGYNASNELANSLGNALSSQASLGYAGAANRNQMTLGTLAAIMGALANGGKAGATGGVF